MLTKREAIASPTVSPMGEEFPSMSTAMRASVFQGKAEIAIREVVGHEPVGVIEALGPGVER
jgi:threonine dehydrogenase-like Zn-dependent dehydrogenase